MGRISKLLTLTMLYSKVRGTESSNVEELRLEFKARYHNFKLLLNANSRSLEVMAEMEEALKGTWPFGMTHIQSLCTRVSADVWQIIKNLNELASGKYEKLYDRFREIQKNINLLAYPKNTHKEGPLVLPLKEVDKNLADQVGGKIANLGELRNRICLTVPNGFVITVQAYQQFMEYNDLQTEIDRRIQAASAEHLDQLYSLSADVQQLIIRSPLREDLEKAISEQYRLLEEKDGKGVRVAMRSSALGEDLVGTSFAGQYRSELNVSSENIFHAYREIVASKYSLPAMTYRLNRGIRDEDVVMCVGCMSMVEAVSSGIVYSINPVDIRDNAVVINAVWGLPKSVVDGSTASDLFIVSRENTKKILRKKIGIKDQKYVSYPDEGIRRMDTDSDESRLASLSDEQAVELAHLALELEDYYGIPQDIEWAMDTNGSIVILQCRPLKQAEVHKVQDIRAVQEEGSDSVILRGGVTASPGVAAGPVFIVKKNMDALQFPDEAVLVTAQSLPRWATLLNHAAAVVTEQGSVTGHLANVSREFGVPALFGVKAVGDRLKNGQWVTVDADGLRIYEGRIHALLERQVKRKYLMEGSPVFESLKGVAQQIIPLNLLDPDSPEFKPKSCKTFHDITRFCHEKAVYEMFQFGKEHHFPERSSKQLFYDVPMKWWVLNLDDGFKEEVEGKYVQMENIISIPMLALWEGITAVPWEGPPPIDGKGFMSVMFQATRNTALVPGLPSRYADRNYFMISENYCSLNSRFGFHFSIIEALVSDRSPENYISFQFKGGAADYQRRLERIYLIRDIVEEHGFRVEIKEDNLIARLEGHEKDFMRKGLKILGYLTIHTRQLDMIVSNSASINHQRAKIMRDLKEVVTAQ